MKKNKNINHKPRNKSKLEPTHQLRIRRTFGFSVLGALAILSAVWVLVPSNKSVQTTNQERIVNTETNEKLSTLAPALQQMERTDQQAEQAVLNQKNESLGSKSQLSSQGAAEVKWANFSSEISQGQAQLRWLTAIELNTEAFVVERSLNKIDFEQIGKVKAAGAADGRTLYSFDDNELMDLHMPLVYYRVKHPTRSGGALFSRIIEQNLDLNMGVYVKAIPDSKRERLTIRYAADKPLNLELQLMNTAGEIMLSRDSITADLISKDLSFDVSSWEKGTYYIQLIGDENSITERVELK